MPAPGEDSKFHAKERNNLFLFGKTGNIVAGDINVASERRYVARREEIDAHLDLGRLEGGDGANEGGGDAGHC